MALLYFCASDPEKSEKQRSRVDRRDTEEECNSSTSGTASVLGAGYSMGLVPMRVGAPINLVLPSL